MKRREGFTLVELLIAIAIIAIMFGLLMFAVQKARQSVNNTVCINNLRKITQDSLFNYDSKKKLISSLVVAIPPVCPLVTYPLYSTQAEKNKYSAPADSDYTYGFNTNIHYKRIKNILLSRTICSSDSAWKFQTELGDYCGSRWIGYSLQNGHYRHPGKTQNVGYLDGHVGIVTTAGDELGGPGASLQDYGGMQ